ncbi:MAG: hypothetical protein L6V93_03890 [Clostridiales bacterium]|nr:MAG: hypothetical protein L6V93_03890 [Clostridiales bacterium]
MKNESEKKTNIPIFLFNLYTLELFDAFMPLQTQAEKPKSRVRKSFIHDISEYISQKL